MRLTPRCLNLLRLLRTARWLTTSQLHARFFSHATLDATRKRLRKLTAEEYLIKVQPQRMEHAVFSLGRKGKRMLERSDVQTVTLERQPPVQFEHFAGVNDIRIGAELSGDLSYFFAYWELPGLGWRNAIIPDGIFSLRGRTFAVEYDRGLEGLQFFLQTKMAAYQHGLEGFPLSALVIVTDTVPRMAALAKAIGPVHIQVFFATLDVIRVHGLLDPVFYRIPGAEGVAIV